MLVFHANVSHFEQVAHGAVIRRQSLVVADQRLELARPRIRELLLHLQDLEIRGHAVFVSAAFGFEVLLGGVPGGARRGNVLRRGVDGPHRLPNLQRDVYPLLFLVAAGPLQFDLRALRLGARADVGDGEAHIECHGPRGEV